MSRRLNLSRWGSGEIGSYASSWSASPKPHRTKVVSSARICRELERRRFAHGCFVRCRNRGVLGVASRGGQAEDPGRGVTPRALPRLVGSKKRGRDFPGRALILSGCLCGALLASPLVPRGALSPFESKPDRR